MIGIKRLDCLRDHTALMRIWCRLKARKKDLPELSRHQALLIITVIFLTSLVSLHLFQCWPLLVSRARLNQCPPQGGLNYKAGHESIGGTTHFVTSLNLGQFLRGCSSGEQSFLITEGGALFNRPLGLCGEVTSLKWIHEIFSAFGSQL